MKNLQKGGGNLSSSLRSHLNMTSCWHAGYLKTILIFKKDNNKILPILNGICFDENLYIRHHELLQMKKGDNPLLEIKKTKPSPFNCPKNYHTILPTSDDPTNIILLKKTPVLLLVQQT